jgi:hypothetical protein
MHAVVRCAQVVAGAFGLVLAGAGVASAAGPPVLAWSPSGTVNFGTLAPGATSPPQVFTLKNGGGSASSALTVTVTPSAGFTITLDGCTATSLGPNKSCTVSVIFTAPATPGSYQATLTATSKKPAATATVTLTGTSGKATPAIATTAEPASAAVGAQIADQATVTGGSSPTGTVTFNLYGNPTCKGTALFTDSNAPLANGTASSASYTTTAAGTVYWVATYNGDGANSSVSSGCGDEPVTISTCLVTDTTSGQTYTDLPDAVNAAAAGDTLDVAGTCTGPTTIGKDLTITGSTGATLDGQQQGSTLTINSGVTVTLNTLTITDGLGSGGPNGDGGGIYNDGGTVALNNTTVSGNFAGFHLGAGGGIESTGGTVTLNGTSSVTGNFAVAGGGIRLVGATLVLDGSNNSISNNTVDDFGGGILSDTASTVTLGPGTSISNNAGGQAGGGIENDGTLTLDGASITGNTASDSNGTGGGIDNDGGTVTGTASITGNSAGFDGGGIYNVNQGTVTGTFSVTGNTPDNCAPPDSVPGCTG